MKRLGSSFRERNDKNSRTQQRPNLLSGFFEDPPSWLDSSSDAAGIEQTIEQTEFYFLLFALDFFFEDSRIADFCRIATGLPGEVGWHFSTL